MKTKTTSKAIKQYYRPDQILNIGYCGASYLLKYEEATGYNAGVYGWNYDLYEMDGVAIITGYRGIGERVDHKLLERYELKAREIAKNWALGYETIRKQINKLLREWITKEKEARA